MRGIPSANVVRISLPAGVDNISPAQLASAKAQLDAALPAGVQATLLTWTRPFRVQGSCGMSITSAFALGYDVKYCNNVFTAPISYYDADTTRPWTELGIRPAMMLGANTYAEAVALIDRGLASEASYPAGDGYLIRTTDSARSGPRWQDFSLLPAAWGFEGGLTLNYIDNATGTASNTVTGKNPVLFYFTGLESVQNLGTNVFVPGTDRIDLSEVLASIGYTAQNALKLGVVRLHNVSNSVQISIDTDGTAGPSAGIGLVRLRGLSVSALDPVRDLQLQP